MIVRALLTAVAFVALATNCAVAQTAKAAVKNADGATVGSIDLTQVSDGVLVKLAVKGLPPGEHAFHVHAVGKCEPPFTTAGGHFNPGNKKHGMMSTEGHHAGDMPNLIVPASGEVAVEVVNTGVTLEKGKPNSLYKPEGTAFVIHAAADDYKTDPTGNAGGRIACAVVE
ncbi:superoxide dismutase family protein [Bradyrhizobium prioriisuperbiae]|uniref:superoxide dismutase family protein n=1 Tax=Bradyrhizobium prioriisuperbiae TaxID=2854389 RepID=UPI0028EA940C|nr:superoxide dismutase family protein [Bradyrhizobium prioritasuperba]